MSTGKVTSSSVLSSSVGMNSSSFDGARGVTGAPAAGVTKGGLPGADWDCAGAGCDGAGAGDGCDAGGAVCAGAVSWPSETADHRPSTQNDTTLGSRAIRAGRMATSRSFRARTFDSDTQRTFPVIRDFARA